MRQRMTGGLRLFRLTFAMPIAAVVLLLSMLGILGIADLCGGNGSWCDTLWKVFLYTAGLRTARTGLPDPGFSVHSRGNWGIHSDDAAHHARSQPADQGGIARNAPLAPNRTRPASQESKRTKDEDASVESPWIDSHCHLQLIDEAPGTIFEQSLAGFLVGGTGSGCPFVPSRRRARRSLR